MAKNSIAEYDSSAGNNLDVGGVNLAEGMAPSGVNNAIRELMSHLKDQHEAPPQDGSAIKVTATSGTTARTLADRAAEFYNVKDFGAKGNNSTNDTTSFTSAVAASSAGGIIVVSPGIYLVDQVDHTKRISWILARGATLKLRTSVSGDTAILKFSSGSEGSSVEGGVLDGNRAALSGGYTANDEWNGIHTDNVDDFSFSNITFQNFIKFAFWVQGARTKGTNITVKTSGTGSQIKKCNNSHFSNMVFDAIGNNGEAIFQHANEWRDCDGAHFTNITVRDFQPDASATEPSPAAFVFERCDNLVVNGLIADTFSGTGNPGVIAKFDNLRGATINNVIGANGYDSGVEFSGVRDTVFDGFSLDGSFATAGTGNGLNCSVSGLYPTIGGAVSSNARSVIACRNLHISNGILSRWNTNGVLLQSPDVTFHNVRAIACVQHGFRGVENLAQSLFPNAVTPVNEHLQFIGCDARNCGQTGLRIETGRDISVVGGAYSNNGQDTSAGANARAGLVLENVDRVIVSGVLLTDTQTFATKTDGASFTPGTTDANDQYTLSFIDPRQIQIGQHITLKNVDGGDETVKVIQILLDDITVEFTAAVTLVDTGNLTSLTGTFSSNGTTLTGSSSSLNTEITGRTVIKANGEYRIVRRVNSATVAILESAFTSDLSGDTAEKVTIDVDSIQSQQRGVRLETTGTDIDIQGNHFDGNAITVSDAGATNLKIRNNSGYVTENSGTATIVNGNTAITVTHNLDVTPTVDDISVVMGESPTNDPGNVWVDTITSTQFNINCRADPGGSNLDFGWRAIVL